MAADPGPSLLILYASQTGNAQDVAERVEREARRRHYRPRLLPADAYLPHIHQLPSEAAIVFVVSTTGQGEPPDNVAQLWRFLRRKSLAPGSLAGVNVAVFGLGDSGYLKYNVMAKLLSRRLEALGAEALVPLALGDDQHRSGHEAALDPWLPQLWVALRRRFPLPPGASEPAPEDASGEPTPKYKVTLLPGPPADAQQRQFASPQEEAVTAAAALDAVDAAARGLPPVHESSAGEGPQLPSATRPHFAALASNQRVTSQEHFQDVRMLRLDLEGSGISFDPGDVIAVWPGQRQDAVDAFLGRCGLDPGAWVRIQPADAASASSAHSSSLSNGGAGEGASEGGVVVRVGALVAGALDVASAVPRRVLFETLRRFTPPGGREHDRLSYFSTPEGRDDLHEYNRREGRSVLEVLQDFPSASPPLEWLLGCVPRLQPRRFSAASSLAARPDCVELLVAVVEWATPGRRRRRGLCSSWLAGLPAGAAVPVWAERGALRMPPDAGVPLILVGPGTGVAPFRAFLQERLAQRQRGLAPPPAPCVLAFGCRSAAADYYCRSDWAAMQEAGVLGGAGGGLLVAFSRDQEAKVYVTHRIREHGRELWAALAAGAAVYVAGSADRMPADVAAAFRDVASQHGGLAPDEAERFVKRMEAAGRYQVEAWS